MAQNNAKVIVGTNKNPGRSTFMFCRILKEPEDGEGSAKGKCAILFPKSDKKMKKKVDDAILAAGKKKFGDKFKLGGKYLSPIRCGTEMFEDEDYTVGEEAKDMWMLSTSCYKVPQLVDKSGQRVIDPEELEEMMVSGNYFLFSVTMKGFDNESKGVRAELNNLMFQKKGERLDGSASAESEFGDYATDSDYDDDDDDDDDDDSGITKKELQSLYKEAVAETSKKKAKKVLAKFDVEAIKELDEDEYDAVAKALNKLIG